MSRSIYRMVIAVASLMLGRVLGQANRRVFVFMGEVKASPKRVLPLLCPIREQEWIEGWQADVVYSTSGVAEDNAIFATHLRSGETWVTSRYEPAQGRVEYSIFGGNHAVMRLDLMATIAPSGETQLSIRRTYTGLDWFGRRMVDKLEEKKIQVDNARLVRQLNHYLEEGTMLHEQR